MGRKSKPLPTPLEWFRLFHKINQDCATTGEVVAPLTIDGFDKEFYAEQIQNILEGQGRNISDRVADRLADQLHELIGSGKVYTVIRSWTIQKQEVTIAAAPEEAEGTIDWSKVEDDYDPTTLEVYEGGDQNLFEDPVHQVDY